MRPFKPYFLGVLCLMGMAGCSSAPEPPADTSPKQPTTAQNEVNMTPAQIQEMGLQLKKAKPEKLQMHVSLNGEVLINTDRVAHIVPRVPGVVRQVYKTLGQSVARGELMAVLESTELGRAKIDYFTQQQQLKMAQTTYGHERTINQGTNKILKVLHDQPPLDALRKFKGDVHMGHEGSQLITAYTNLVISKQNYDREKILYDKKISNQVDLLKAESEYKKLQAVYDATYHEVEFISRQELLNKQMSVTVAQAGLNTAQQRLKLLGLPGGEWQRLQQGQQGERASAQLEIRSPFSGTVVEKDITLGEALRDDANIFTIADLSTLWVNLNVFQKDLPLIHTGQKVIVSAGYGIPDTTVRIDYVSPMVNEKTHTAFARIVLPNEHRIWRPGLFVTGRLVVDEVAAAVAVDKSSLQKLAGQTVVFVRTVKGFRAQPVKTGRGNVAQIEILQGLTAGQEYVSKGSFSLKAEALKSTIADEE